MVVSVSIGSGPLGGNFIKNIPTYSDTSGIRVYKIRHLIPFPWEKGWNILENGLF